MSTRRILALSVFGVLFIAALIGVMLLTSFMKRDHAPIPLPEISAPADAPGYTEPDMLNRIEITSENVQAVISTLSRPATYNRDVTVESYWESGQAVYSISVYVANGVTSLRSLSSAGVDKRIIIGPDMLYIWYRGDRSPYIGAVGTTGDDLRSADEYQMMVTYEDVLGLDKDCILDAGYVEYGGEWCIYTEYRQPGLGYIMKYFISTELGLITGAEEYDAAGGLTYRMSAGECSFDADESAFTLPDGTVVNEFSASQG